VKARIADLPLENRRVQEIEKQRELAEGLTSRHMAEAAYDRGFRAYQLARVPMLAVMLRGR
jgi:hypothetical protein